MTAAGGRYAGSKSLVHKTRDGTTVTYLATRLLPLGSTVAGGRTATIRTAEVYRPDLLSDRTLHNPLLAYSIADANDAMDPLVPCSETGRVVAIPASDL